MKEFWKKFLKLKETENKNLRNGIENMVTDEILCAVQSMTELFDTPDARNAGNAIWKMLADFDEDSWHEKVNSGTIKEWQQHYIED